MGELNTAAVVWLSAFNCIVCSQQSREGPSLQRLHNRSVTWKRKGNGGDGGQLRAVKGGDYDQNICYTRVKMSQ